MSVHNFECAGKMWFRRRHGVPEALHRPQGYSVLVFCGSKRQCETTAMFLAKLVLRPPTTALEVVEGRQAMSR